MPDNEKPISDSDVVVEVSRSQLEYFTGSDPRCRGVQLPEGIMLRYTLSQSLYFYLRTGVLNGKITTRVFASDSPYDPQKNSIGEVVTPMFEHHADAKHLTKVQGLLLSWVEFVKEGNEPGPEFRAFEFDTRPE